MKIKQITAYPVFIPYEAPVGPYVGRPRSDRTDERNAGTLGATALIVRIDADEAFTGWGEGTGTLSADDIAPFYGAEALNIEGALAIIAQAGIGAGPASGIEMALWDLQGKVAGLPVHTLLGGRVRDRADFTACMGIKEPAEAAETARIYYERWGFTSIKTKAGHDAPLDLAIAAAIVQEMGDQAQLRPDANAGYSEQVGVEQMRRMRDVGVTRFEDPVGREHLDALVQIRQEGTQVLVNMGVAGPGSVADLLVAGAADALMPDTPAAGGLLPVQKVARVAEGFDVPCLMHCAHDLGLKTTAITHIAAATPNFSGPSDTCYHGLVDDVLAEQLVFEGGSIAVPDGPGLGVVVDEEKLVRYAVT